MKKVTYYAERLTKTEDGFESQLTGEIRDVYTDDLKSLPPSIWASCENFHQKMNEYIQNNSKSIGYSRIYAANYDKVFGNN